MFEVDVKNMMEEWRNGEGGGPAQVFSWMVGHMTKIKKMETPKIKIKVDKPTEKYPLQYQQSKWWDIWAKLTNIPSIIQIIF